jgi:NAD(P)-dependent dehydrogenase (short-subunit alcohol dehydrogenase family)
MRFAGRVVIVTGAGKGIGAAIARGFAREGGRLALLDVDGAALDRLVKELMDGGTEVMGVPADVTRAGDVGQAVEAVVARWGRVDVLVNNAGGFSVIRRTEEIPDDEWDTIFRFNVTSIFLCTKAVLPIMKRQRAGRIVNMSSVAGRAGAVTVTSHYAAAKAAVIGFTRHVAREVAAEGITVNAVAPGTVGTERWKAPQPRRVTATRGTCPHASRLRARRDCRVRDVPRLRRRRLHDRRHPGRQWRPGDDVRGDAQPIRLTLTRWATRV